jgi:hypothetical protein
MEAVPLCRFVRHSVEWTVRDMIGRYPSLFHSRTQAIHHLFIVLGCGYEWIDGKLVERHESRAGHRIPMEAVEILANHKMPIERVYPWTELCNLAELPEDADADWKAAAEEARHLLPNALGQTAETE